MPTRFFFINPQGFSLLVWLIAGWPRLNRGILLLKAFSGLPIYYFSWWSGGVDPKTATQTGNCRCVLLNNLGNPILEWRLLAKVR